MLNHSIKLTIWDLDGTLVDSLPATYAAMNNAFEKFIGRRLDPAEIMSHFGRPEADIITRIVGEKHALECIDLVRMRMHETLHTMVAYPGVHEALAQVHKMDLKKGVCTGRSRKGADIIMDHQKLASHFSWVIGGDEVANHKPHPEGPLWVCAQSGIAPENAVMIGDSPQDVFAGNAAGMQTIACTWAATVPQEELLDAKPSFVAHSYDDILKYLLNRNR